MSRFACHVAGTAVQLPVQNQSRAKAGAKGEENHIIAALSRTPQPFRQSAGVGVVLHGSRNAEPLLKGSYHIDVVPMGQIWGAKDYPGFGVQRAAAADAHRFQLDFWMGLYHRFQCSYQPCYRFVGIRGGGKLFFIADFYCAVFLTADADSAFGAADVDSRQPIHPKNASSSILHRAWYTGRCSS